MAGEFTVVSVWRSKVSVALGDLLRIPLKGFALVAFVSHKLLRWIVPFLLLSMLASSFLLLRFPLYRAALVTQVIFYLWAGVGYLFEQRLSKVRFGLLGYFLLAMNLAFLVGFWRFLFSHRDATRQKAN
jgi:hypothetical protein